MPSAYLLARSFAHERHRRRHCANQLFSGENAAVQHRRTAARSRHCREERNVSREPATLETLSSGTAAPAGAGAGENPASASGLFRTMFPRSRRASSPLTGIVGENNIPGAALFPQGRRWLRRSRAISVVVPKACCNPHCGFIQQLLRDAATAFQTPESDCLMAKIMFTPSMKAAASAYRARARGAAGPPAGRRVFPLKPRLAGPAAAEKRSARRRTRGGALPAALRALSGGAGLRCTLPAQAGPGRGRVRRGNAAEIETPAVAAYCRRCCRPSTSKAELGLDHRIHHQFRQGEISRRRLAPRGLDAPPCFGAPRRPRLAPRLGA